jgi:hypothetical protein
MGVMIETFRSYWEGIHASSSTAFRDGKILGTANNARILQLSAKYVF